MNKVFLYRSGDPAKARVLLLAPTGVAAININGTLWFAYNMSRKFLLLNDANKAVLRNKYSEVELVIIDEILMVSSKLFYQIHKSLNEIFSPGQDVPLYRKSVLIRGDLCQLPPVRANPVFTFDDTETMERFRSRDL